MGKVKLGNYSVSMARLQPAKRHGNRMGEIIDSKIGMSRMPAKGNVAIGRSIVTFWVAMGSRTSSPFP